MQSASKTYLMVLPVSYYRIDEHSVALESAFIEHLRLLKEKISPIFSNFLIGMPEMSAEEYERRKPGLSVLNEQGMVFKTIYKSDQVRHRFGKYIQLFSISKRLQELIKDCDILHTGLAPDIWFPVEFLAMLWGIYFKKKILYVVDIDFRNSAFMSYKTGGFSLKSYLLCKYVYDKLREFQINIAVSQCALILLKGEKLCRDFGQGKPQVKNFLDAAHSHQYIIDQATLEQKLARLTTSENPLEVVFFGRLTAYKGVDYCMRAIAIAKQKLNCNVIFHVIGTGDEEENLRNLSQELNLDQTVVFHGAYPFDLNFFKRLYGFHLLLAAPLSEDTPRSALDAMAAGIPVLAFDTYYYRDLTSTGAVATVPWLSVEQLAEKIADYGNNRQLLAQMVVKAVDFAKQNTQEEWLERRLEWTLTYAGFQQT